MDITKESQFSPKSLLSQHLVPSHDLIHAHTHAELSFANLTESSVIVSSVITKLLRLKNGLSQDVEDNRQQPGKTLRQAGNKPEKYSDKPGPVQSACYKTYVGLWRIISAMQHTSEHITCSVEICLNIRCYAACA